MPLDESSIERALSILRSRNFMEPDPVDLEVCTQWMEIKLDKGLGCNPSHEIYKKIYDKAPPSDFGNPETAVELCLKIREVKGAPPISKTETRALKLYLLSLTDVREEASHVPMVNIAFNNTTCSLCNNYFDRYNMRSISAITMTSAFKNRLLPKDEDLQRILKEHGLTVEQYQESSYKRAREETSNCLFCPNCASRVIEKASVGKRSCAVALVLLMAVPTLLLSTALVWKYAT